MRVLDAYLLFSASSKTGFCETGSHLFYSFEGLQKVGSLMRVHSESKPSSWLFEAPFVQEDSVCQSF